MTKVLRLGTSTERVTQGNIYELKTNGKITDNTGSDLKPRINKITHRGNFRYYWIVFEEEYESSYIDPVEVSRLLLHNKWIIEQQLRDRWEGEAVPSWVSETDKDTQTMSKFLKIESVTLIDNRRADEMSIDDLLNMVRKEEKEREQLENMTTDSKVINKLIRRRSESIAVLLSEIERKEAEIK